MKKGVNNRIVTAIMEWYRREAVYRYYKWGLQTFTLP